MSATSIHQSKIHCTTCEALTESSTECAVCKSPIAAPAPADLLRVHQIVRIELIASTEVSFRAFGMCLKFLRRLRVFNKPEISDPNVHGFGVVLLNSSFAEPAGIVAHAVFPKLHDKKVGGDWKRLLKLGPWLVQGVTAKYKVTPPPSERENA